MTSGIAKFIKTTYMEWLLRLGVSRSVEYKIIIVSVIPLDVCLKALERLTDNGL